MTIFPSITIDTGYEGNEGQTFEDYKIKGFLLLRNPYYGSEERPNVPNPGRVIDDRKILVNIWVYAYKYDERSGEKIDDVVLRKMEFLWEVDKRMCEPHKWLAEIVRDFLGDNICVKSWGGGYFGSIGTFLSNVDFCFTNNLEMETDFFDFLRFCDCFKKIDEKLTKQYVRRYRFG